MFDFYRVCCSVPNTHVANVNANRDEILENIKKACEEKSNFVIFPELSLCGYTCGDLFFQETLLSKCASALEEVAEFSKNYDVTVVLGSPIRIYGDLYNCGVVIYGGIIKGIIPKTFLPNYNEFYEKRWFSSSEDLKVSEIAVSHLGLKGDYTVPVGRDLVFEKSGVRFGVEVCEDLWTPIPPGTFLCLNGAEIMFNISASNETIAKRSYRRNLVAQQSARSICGYVYCSAGSKESTQDLVFSGHSIVAENGKIINENKEIIDSGYSLFTDIDLGKIRSDRFKIKSFKDSGRIYGKDQKSRFVYIGGEKSVGSDGKLYKVSKHPFVPEDKKDRLERCLSIFKMQVSGLKKRLSITKGKLVIGVSGGLDSTLALLVCAETVRQMGKPLTDVVGITMPCFGTTDRTYNNSIALMKALGVEVCEISIKDACIGHFKDIGHDIRNLDGTYENSQARERTQVLMDYASKVNGFVVGTGDLSELALGWCTYNGDHMSMYGVNVSIPKTLVRWMIDSIIEYNVFDKGTEVLRDILDTPISPELLPPNSNGEISQETEDIIGPYELHDFFLYYVMRYGYCPEKIYFLAKKAFSDIFDKKTILKWLKAFYKRFFSQQFKRSCLPDGVKVGSICLSPRGDFRMPSDSEVEIWLEELENLK